MKCPKCGYNSFEYFDNCIKCSNDLTAYKQTYSISPLVLPLIAKERMAAEFRSAESSPDESNDSIETHDDIFSFDLPEESSPVAAQVNDDPFNFDEPSTVAYAPAGTKSDDVFADLLESTSQSEESPFAAPRMQTPPSQARPADTTSSPGEFDLESFSWDDTPVATLPAGSTETLDDFDSLFGDTKENPQ